MFHILHAKKLLKAKIHPYRVTRVQKLQPTDHEKRIQFFVWFKNFINQNPGILDLTWFTDEAWFHPSGYINSQNTRIWEETNPHIQHAQKMECGRSVT